MLNLNNKSNKVRFISDGGGYITHKNVKLFALIISLVAISFMYNMNVVSASNFEIGIEGESTAVFDGCSKENGNFVCVGHVGFYVYSTCNLNKSVYINSKCNFAETPGQCSVTKNFGVEDARMIASNLGTTLEDLYKNKCDLKFLPIFDVKFYNGAEDIVGGNRRTGRLRDILTLISRVEKRFLQFGKIYQWPTKSVGIVTGVAFQDKKCNVETTVSNILANKSCFYSSGDNYYGIVNIAKFFNPDEPDEPEEPTCESEFEKIDIYDMDERIELYEEWGHKGLLDMSNTTAEDACGPSSCGKKASTSCLSGSYENKYFDDDDISCFNATYSTSNGGTAFCLESFTLRNNLSSSTFYTNSGRLPIQYLAKTIAATGTLTRKCYIYGGGALSKPKYSNYVSEVKLDNRVLDYDLNENTSGSWWSVYTGTAKYYLNPIYAETGTGEVSYSALNNYYKFMGYGVISQFNYKNQYNIQFSLRLGSSFPLSTKSYSSTACKVIPTQEVIITDDNPKKPDKLRLEFRIIDTSNPFPGKSGTVRIVGTNWRATSNLLTSNSSYSNWLNNNWKKSSSYINHSYAERADNRGFNSYASYIMETTNNSYNKNKTGPKYKFLLTPTEIKNIRDYNKKNKYDDFTLTCEKDATNCKSTKFFNEVGLKNLVNN